VNGGCGVGVAVGTTVGVADGAVVGMDVAVAVTVDVAVAVSRGVALVEPLAPASGPVGVGVGPAGAATG
jgi:hypothetical protein